jgi:hypothetical protein
MPEPWAPAMAARAVRRLPNTSERRRDSGDPAWLAADALDAHRSAVLSLAGGWAAEAGLVPFLDRNAGGRSVSHTAAQALKDFLTSFSGKPLEKRGNHRAASAAAVWPGAGDGADDGATDRLRQQDREHSRCLWARRPRLREGPPTGPDARAPRSRTLIACSCRSRSAQPGFSDWPD